MTFYHANHLKRVIISERTSRVSSGKISVTVLISIKPLHRFIWNAVASLEALASLRIWLEEKLDDNTRECIPAHESGNTEHHTQQK